MKTTIQTTLAIVLTLAVLRALGWLFTANGLAMSAWFSPKYEQVRRDTFEQSKAYRDGMAQELRALQIEYIKADDKIKPALATAIKHKAAGVPDDALPYDLQQFIKELP